MMSRRKEFSDGETEQSQVLSFKLGDRFGGMENQIMHMEEVHLMIR